MKRSAKAIWKGNLQQGQGIISTESGVIAEVPYSFNTRFKDTPGTNPEELIAAAHASCFTMATSAGLTSKGLEPQILDTTATITLEKEGEGWNVKASHLVLRAVVNDVSEERFPEDS